MDRIWSYKSIEKNCKWNVVFARSVDPWRRVIVEEKLFPLLWYTFWEVFVSVRRRFANSSEGNRDLQKLSASLESSVVKAPMGEWGFTAYVTLAAFAILAFMRFCPFVSGAAGFPGIDVVSGETIVFANACLLCI